MTQPWNMAKVRSRQLPRKPYKPVAPVGTPKTIDWGGARVDSTHKCCGYHVCNCFNPYALKVSGQQIRATREQAKALQTPYNTDMITIIANPNVQEGSLHFFARDGLHKVEQKPGDDTAREVVELQNKLREANAQLMAANKQVNELAHLRTRNELLNKECKRLSDIVVAAQQKEKRNESNRNHSVSRRR